jgi:hypothetical protein
MKFFDNDPGFVMGKIGIWDPRWKKIRIRDKHAGSPALIFLPERYNRPLLQVGNPQHCLSGIIKKMLRSQ